MYLCDFLFSCQLLSLRGDICRRNNSYLHVGDHLFTKQKRLARRSYVFSRIRGEAYHRNAQPARTAWRGRSCCWDKVNIAALDHGVFPQGSKSYLSRYKSHQVSMCCCRLGVTKLRAFVEAGRSHVDARDQRRGGSGWIRTSVAISAGVFGRVVDGRGGRVRGGAVGGGGGGGEDVEGGQYCD
jgi:hypothetical protein